MGSIFTFAQKTINNNSYLFVLTGLHFAFLCVQKTQPLKKKQPLNLLFNKWHGGGGAHDSTIQHTLSFLESPQEVRFALPTV